MLQQLIIKNVAIIENVTIEFGGGFNVITGETGAGKSLIIGCINAILGDRISKDMVRNGADKAVIQAIFYVEDRAVNDLLSQIGIQIEQDCTLILCREITENGRSLCWINSKAVTASTLREVGNLLVDIHGQQDNQSLFNVSNHIKLLDLFGGTEIFQLKSEYWVNFNEYKKIKFDIEKICTQSDEIEQRIDYLKFQCNEIESAHLSIGEEDELLYRKNVLINSQKILQCIENAYDILYSNEINRTPVIDELSTIIKQIGDITNIEPRFLPISESFESVTYQLEDIISEMRDIKQTVECQPSCIDEINERLDVIAKLKRKYGGSIQETIGNLHKMKKELELLSNKEEKLRELTKKQSQLSTELLRLSELLSNNRCKAGRILEDNICDILEQLDMKKTKFKADIKFNSCINNNQTYSFSEDGLNTVEFLISTAPGQPLKPLNKIASGGEMSRIMLAIKCILANVDSIPTLVFDEIDMGISGKAAQQVAEKMAAVATLHQVICVTHLAHIACMADSHYKIVKNFTDNSTNIAVQKLEEDAVVYEIARIVGGSSITELTLKHVSEMLGLSKQRKQTSNNLLTMKRI